MNRINCGGRQNAPPEKGGRGRPILPAPYMLKEKNNRIFLSIGLIVFCAGLAAGALWDLQIDLALYRPDFFPAILMEAFGWLPQYLPVLLLAACFMLDSGRSTVLRIVCGVLCAVSLGILAMIGRDHLLQRGIAPAVSILWALFLSACVILLSFLVFHSCRGTARKKLEWILVWGTVYLAAGLVIINVCKAIWQRTRFDDMLNAAGGIPENAFALFTGWLHPFGNGGSSFPSGHTAAACCVFVLVLACDLFPEWNRRRTLIWVLCWCYVAWMALSRLLMGRHYLSDTLAASFIMLVLFLGITHLRRYREGTRKLSEIR